jgi:hypothetical protein
MATFRIDDGCSCCANVGGASLRAVFDTISSRDRAEEGIISAAGIDDGSRAKELLGKLVLDSICTVELALRKEILSVLF